MHVHDTPERRDVSQQRAVVPARGARPANGALSPAELLALQRTVGNAAVSGLIAERHPVQRAVVHYNRETDTTERVTLDQLKAMPEFRNLSPGQEAGVAAKVASSDFFQLTELLDQVRGRSTVIGAVSGPHEREGNFLAEMADKRSPVFAYDPEMQTEELLKVLEDEMVNEGAVLLQRQSITAFGEHVPDIDVFVPNPGPWLYAAPLATDLAACLNTVLGKNSHAWVLTDNEPYSRQAATLESRLDEINRDNAAQSGYLPLRVTSKRELNTSSLGARGQLELGAEAGRDGVEFEVGHSPDYCLLKISRH
ncbi:hypothetical protein ACQPZF_38085 [Actinosynnema sp. CS-041913]|uniref:hypothetical protein n=1 Tax=Actinosynnema sp. CS-041913 TaxID=3239917 RepID=UPI003D8A2498